MKKVLSILLAVVLCVSLLPTAIFAATALSHVDITIELPKGGDYFDWNATPVITSFNGDGIDLLANGAGFLKTEWVGDYDLDDSSNPYFRNGGSYKLTVKLMFGSGYCANSTTAFTGETVAMPETFSATVNGVAATVTRNTSAYYPEIQVNLKLEGEIFTAEQKSERDKEWDELRKARRATYTPRTRAEAETYNRDNMPENVVVVNDPEGRDLTGENITTIVFNVSTADKMAESIAHSDYLKEIWLSPEVNPYDFMRKFRRAQRNIIAGTYSWESSAAIPLYLSEGTVFIPESRVSEFKQTMDDEYFNGYIGGALTIKCYSGDDVIAAQKAGASAAKELCTEHKYNTQITSADRVCHFADHDDHYLYYYSCDYCGKCEYNPNHLGYNIEMVNLGYIHFDTYKAIQRHSDNAELPADEVYVGVNAAGEHVWWQSCELCGVINPYSFNEYDQLETVGADRPFEEWKAQTIAGNKRAEEQALNSTERYFPGFFSLPLKSDAKISAWAQSDVNFALNDNLIDTAMLGNDYTQNISRLQFCSVAVKLAEELTGKSITPADSGTFTDTSDVYALKAYSAGIAAGTSDTTFSPNGTLTRQEMATFLYRTLRYVEKNSDYSYTDYTSKLSNYTDDNWSIRSWAEEAMAFMNALDLVKGVSATALNPDGLCTIEQAVAVADRSVYAHLLGWYQVNPKKNMSPTSELGKGRMGGYALREGDYVWVTGRRYGVKTSVYSEEYKDSLWVPIINPFNGQAAYMKYGDLIPVRN